MVKNVRPPVPDTTTKTLFDDATLFIFQFWLYDCNVIVYYDVITGNFCRHLAIFYWSLWSRPTFFNVINDSKRE